MVPRSAAIWAALHCCRPRALGVIGRVAVQLRNRCAANVTFAIGTFAQQGSWSNDTNAVQRRWPVSTLSGGHLHLLIDPEKVAAELAALIDGAWFRLAQELT